MNGLAASLAPMQKIDGQWISERLDPNNRGQKARLAEFIGIEQQKLSKVLSGERRVQPDEMLRVIEFFEGEKPLREQPGLSEPDVVPFEIAPGTRLAIAALIPNCAHATAWKLGRDMPAFALCSGDLVLLDLKADRGGGLVVATVSDAAGRDPATSIFRRVGQWLIPDRLDGPAIDVDDPTHSVGVMGRMVGALRGVEV